MKSAVYIFDKPATLKQNQGHQTQNDNVDPKEGYNHAKFERLCINGVRERVNVKVLFLNKEFVDYLPSASAKIKNSGTCMIYLTYSTIVKSFNLTGLEHKISI